jgi:hypothetical protein
MGTLFSLVLIVAGGSILFSIPGVGVLFGVIFAAMAGLLICGIVLARVLNIIASIPVAMSYAIQQEINRIEPVAAQ